MKSMPLSQLPWEAQLLFWILLTLVGVAFGIGGWFLIRYINGQDEINKSTKQKFEEIKSRIEDIRKSQQLYTDHLIKELHNVQKSQVDDRKETLQAVTLLKDDLREIKADTKEAKTITKAVEAHHGVLKTLIVKVNELMILKTKKD